MTMQVRVMQPRVQPFSSAAISGLMSISGGLLLARSAWHAAIGREWAAAGFALLLFLVAFQLWRIYALYAAVDVESLDNSPLLRRALNETVRTFTWGNVLFLLAALAVFQFGLMR